MMRAVVERHRIDNCLTGARKSEEHTGDGRGREPVVMFEGMKDEFGVGKVREVKFWPQGGRRLGWKQRRLCIGLFLLIPTVFKPSGEWMLVMLRGLRSVHVFARWS